MPSIRQHVQIAAAPDMVWSVLMDTPREIYDPGVTASRRSKDGSILQLDINVDNASTDVRGETLRYSAYYRILERNDVLMRRKARGFVAIGVYELPRPLPDSEEYIDVLTVGGGCVVVVSETDVPEKRTATGDQIIKAMLEGLKAYCESLAARSH